MTPYWHFYVIGAGALAMGLLCGWRSEEFTGRRVLARTLIPSGTAMLILTAMYQITNNIRLI